MDPDENYDEAPTWTPTRDPWREVRLLVTVAAVAGLAVWGARALLQNLPAMTLDALNKPAVAVADQKVEPHKMEPTPVAISREDRAIEVKTATTPGKGGQVVRDVSESGR